MHELYFKELQKLFKESLIEILETMDEESFNEALQIMEEERSDLSHKDHEEKI